MNQNKKTLSHKEILRFKKISKKSHIPLSNIKTGYILKSSENCDIEPLSKKLISTCLKI